MTSKGFRNFLFVSAGLAAAACARDDATPAETPEPDDVASVEAPADVETDAASQRPSAPPATEPATPPRLVTIDDIEGLLEAEFTPAENGVRAKPKDEAAKGHLAFLLPDGVVADDYKNFAQFIVGKGWSVFLIEDGQTAAFDGEHGSETCTIVGGVGETARAALKYGFERRETVDGAFAVGLLLNEDESYKKKFPIAIISGGRDGIAPASEASGQHPQYPSQTYFLTIAEANHGGYYEDRTFDGDGEALVPYRQQRLILGEVASNMVDRFCLTRETRVAEEARKAAREAAKNAERESGED